MENKNETPPYASVKKVSDMFELLYSRSFQSLTANDLKDRGFSTADAFQVLATLKFLGLLNDDGTTTDKISKIQLRGDQKTTALKEIVTASYRSLFKVAPEANKLSRDELHNEIVAVYKVSPRISKTAAPLFIWLCQQAGLEVTNEVVTRDRTPKARSNSAPTRQEKLTKKDTPSELPQSPYGLESKYQSFPIGRIKLLVPNEEKYLSSILSGGLKEIKSQIETFVNDIENKTEETPVGSGSQAID